MSRKFSFVQRLHDSESFQKALKKKGQYDQFFSIHAEPNRFGYERLGMLVGKRFINKASKRNQIKRLIREIFRQSSMRSENSLDLVVKFRKAKFEDQFDELKSSLVVLLAKVRAVN